MTSVLRLMAVAFLVASCGGRDHSPPRNLDDACALASERPAYLRAMRDTEREWNVPVPVQMAIIHAESRFDGGARTPHRYALGVIPLGRQSSAYGYSQALDGTWDEYQAATRNRRAQRDDIRDATDFIGWYAAEAQRANSIHPANARELYLAYHEGNTGYARGSYRNQAWLIAVADNVANRAVMYDQQLRTCGRR
ncbi:transglycosylase SLT domain-containing protein [Pararhodobacter zhoushanensis]|uniref:Lytic transglycosylase n=1 Tax=Pararhodobacter zhoushanensis TaxID=2479545 RepID=A0ABT3GUY6_9RHOB|nr:lytic transglycosylase [Pararhodobacter zhoushanensis]MCW1931314.1 lytic transglycosylase [Pararhodobacter zhoushanensis]